MTDDPSSQPIRELSWRQKLSPADQARVRAWLSEHPEAQPAWETELELTEGLARLPNAPVASNFTSRVLAAVEREKANARRERERGWRSAWGRLWHRPWLAKAALAGVLLGSGLLAYHRVQVTEQQRQVAEHQRLNERAGSLKEFSNAALMSDTETLKDFDAIYALNPSPGADEQILSLFQ
jgi:hypothetical protein